MPRAAAMATRVAQAGGADAGVLEMDPVISVDVAAPEEKFSGVAKKRG
jgi:hypothetical protein